MTRFMTLTLDPSKLENLTTEASIKHIKNSWRKFRVYLARWIKKNRPGIYARWLQAKERAQCEGTRPPSLLPFITVLELHKSGLAHYHVLIPLYIPQAWISEAWSAVGGGWKVDIRQVDVHRIRAYLAKYVTKDRLSDIPDGERRFQLSNGMILWPKTPKPGYYISAESIDNLRARHQDAALRVDIRGGVRMVVSFTSKEPVLAVPWDRAGRNWHSKIEDPSNMPGGCLDWINNHAQ